MPSKSNARGKSKIPILLSVSMKNLVGKTHPNSGDNGSKNKKRFRPEHATSLLHRVRLDIVIVPEHGTESQKGANDSKSGEESLATDPKMDRGKEQVIFSSLAPVKTINPSWNHLDECIEDYLALDGYFDSDTGFYRFMRLRIWLVPDDDMEGCKEISSTSSNNTTDVAQSAANPSPTDRQQLEDPLEPLLDISIHPTKLRRLARVPQQLPINSLLLHFSDGSIRATRSLLDIIGDQDGSHNDVNLKDEFGRFGDGAFNLLDQVTPIKKSPSSNNEQAANESDLSNTYSEDSLDDPTSKSLCGFLKQKKLGEKQLSKQHKELMEKNKSEFAWKEDEVITHDVDEERQELERLVQMEEKTLEEDMQSLQQEKSELQTLVEKAMTIETSMNNLRDVINDEMKLTRQSEFFLEARRAKLLRDLRCIYPISITLAEDKYSIRELRIPVDIHSGIVAEDELSAALGFLCHLVGLIGKYLGVQLRYRVFFNSSRSAIQEDGGAVFPLFLARAVERDQLDYAMVLLQRNVDCILKTTGVEYKEGEHILVNTKRVFDTIVDGV